MWRWGAAGVACRAALRGTRSVPAAPRPWPRRWAATPPPPPVPAGPSALVLRSACRRMSDRAAPPPTSYLEAWRACTPEVQRALVVLALCGAVESAGVGMVVPFLPGLAEEFSLGATGVGLVISACAFGKVLSNLPCGWVADTVGRRPLLVWGQVVTAAGILATALAPNPASLFAARFVVGAGAAASTVGTNVYTADVTEGIHKDHRGMFLGVIGSISSFAYVIGPAAGGLVSECIGLRGPFYAFAAITFVTAYPYCKLPETLARVKPAAAAGAAAPALPTTLAGFLKMVQREAADGWKDMKGLLKCDAQVGLVLGAVAVYLGWAAYLTLVPLHAAHVWGANAAQLGIVYSIASGVGLVGVGVAGYCVDKYGRLPVLGVASAINGAGCLLLYLSSTYPEFLAALMVWEVGEALLTAVLGVLAVDLAPKDKRGLSLSLQRQASDVTLLTMPLVLGLLADVGLGAGGGIALTALFSTGFLAGTCALLRRYAVRRGTRL